jgi:uncharacterized protein YkwD
MRAWNYKLICLAIGLFLSCGPFPAHSAEVIFRPPPTAKPLVPDALQDIPTQQYLHGEPSDQEQYMLELVNRVRANPYEECKKLLSSDDRYIQQALDVYQIDIDKLTSDFKSYFQKPPLAFNVQLMEAAQIQTQDMIAHDFQDHTGSDGSTLKDRFNRVGYEYYLGGENIFAYAHSPFHAQAAFLIDWGVEDLGHRDNLLDLGTHTAFREIGICIREESSPRTSVGPLVVSQEFGMATRQTVFITGVVYRDANGNHFYDPGEGLGGVQVMPNHGEYYAVTSASGGFTIPVAILSGKYILKATRTDLPEMMSEVVIDEENVKVDFGLGDPAFGSISGTVIDERTNGPMAGVTVKLEPVNVSFVTGDNGEFLFSDLPVANYTIKPELAGFEFQPDNLTLNLSSGQNFRMRITGNVADQTQGPPPDSTGVSNLVPVSVGTGCATPAVGLFFALAVAGWMLMDPRRP